MAKPTKAERITYLERELERVKKHYQSQIDDLVDKNVKIKEELSEAWEETEELNELVDNQYSRDLTLAIRDYLDEPTRYNQTDLLNILEKVEKILPRYS
jgi:predicted phage gp36 major capsid-like protein